jgi:hypothetical protein
MNPAFLDISKVAPQITAAENGTCKTVNMAQIRQSKPNMTRMRQSQLDYRLGFSCCRHQEGCH